MKKIRPFKDLSLKVKSILIFTMVVFLPIVTLGTLILVEMNKVLKEQAFDYTERNLNTVQTSINNMIQNIDDISTYMIFSDEFRSFLAETSTTEDQPRYKELEEDLKGFFLFHLMSKNHINSITVKGINGNELYLGDPIKANEDQWMNRAEKGAGKITWSYAYPIYSYWEGEVNVISMSRVINDINNINKKIGSVTIRVNEKTLTDMLNKGVTQEQGSTFILNGDGHVVLHQNTKWFGKKYPNQELLQEINENPEKSFYYSINDEEYLVSTTEIESNGWRLVTMIDEQTILKELRGVSNAIFIFLIVAFVLGLIAIIGFYYSIINPILDLTKKTKQVEEGDFSVVVRVTNQDEIGKLKYRFNKMVEQIQYLINTKYRLEIKQRESELTALQNQINPHFLYNTLDMIRWTARMENALETSRLIELLSKMFRISLSKGKLWIPLQQELLYVESYLELQKKRLGSKLTYSIDLDQHIKDVLVLKQILQPLVENSILHGFKGKKEVGMIEISSFAEENDVMIDIKDNGIGVNTQQMNTYLLEESNHDNKGFALSNVNDRLITLFGSEYGLTFLEPEQPGTWVRIRLPLLVEEKDLLRYRKHR
ncbi:sensor histidine kinase [Metabacillus halosaccharovorans]|uniref:sensor histidine kinase n=1 Tax=Metabacillus halosaccharovorans TaxID=930124 RepID=UPI00203D0C3D|nr:sensor histidine kinase [Metabacillus halosaccharovorans]MCM3443070.1 sensor histidine kinase [Metabacillus halosaccharovorans]